MNELMNEKEAALFLFQGFSDAWQRLEQLQKEAERDDWHGQVMPRFGLLEDE
jgi:hypothetical protein